VSTRAAYCQILMTGGRCASRSAANAAVAEVELKHPRPQEMSELTRIYESEPAWSR
jgi:hypothetical protein